MSKHLDIVWTNQFKNDYKLAIKRHIDIDLLDDIIRKLANSIKSLYFVSVNSSLSR